ncbi:hypothetical protein [Hahella sp. NBU794]|uniref:capsular polysaccharide export protein, LipB/KpsS family n=1 Tax=Hahella sp. NBU794 TaxID=3422590 RepID=UPI003D6E4BD3
MKNSSLLFYIDNYERLYFFKRFFSAVYSLEMNPVVITSVPSIHLRLKVSKIKTYLIKRPKKNKSHETEYNRNSLDLLTGTQDRKLSNLVYNSAKSLTLVILKNHNIKLALIFNGSSTVAHAISDSLNENSIKKVYFELANIPGKIFADPDGVNAQSRLFHSPNILDEFSPPPSFEYTRWREWYLSVGNKPLQANLKNKFYLGNILDALLYKTGYGIDLNKGSLISRLTKKNIPGSKSSRGLLVEEKALPDRYVFIPLQVSDDTQLLLNSDFTNAEALIYANKEAIKRGLPLIVKIHPAEKSEKEIDKITAIAKDNNISISNSSASRLVSHASLIITINSSVGLDAIIRKKEVIFLGKTLYEKLTYDRLEKYIYHYLLDINYFNQQDISTSTFNMIIERAYI